MRFLKLAISFWLCVTVHILPFLFYFFQVVYKYFSLHRSSVSTQPLIPCFSSMVSTSQVSITWQFNRCWGDVRARTLWIIILQVTLMDIRAENHCCNSFLASVLQGPVALSLSVLISLYSLTIMDWMFSPSTFTHGNPSLLCDGFRRRGLWEMMRLWRWSSNEWD